MALATQFDEIVQFSLKGHIGAVIAPLEGAPTCRRRTGVAARPCLKFCRISTSTSRWYSCRRASTWRRRALVAARTFKKTRGRPPPHPPGLKDLAVEFPGS